MESFSFLPKILYYIQLTFSATAIKTNREIPTNSHFCSCPQSVLLFLVQNRNFEPTSARLTHDKEDQPKTTFKTVSKDYLLSWCPFTLPLTHVDLCSFFPQWSPQTFMGRKLVSKKVAGVWVMSSDHDYPSQWPLKLYKETVEIGLELKACTLILILMLELIDWLSAIFFSPTNPTKLILMTVGNSYKWLKAFVRHLVLISSVLITYFVTAGTIHLSPLRA